MCVHTKDTVKDTAIWNLISQQPVNLESGMLECKSAPTFCEFYYWLVPTFLYYHHSVSVILKPSRLGMAWKGQVAFIKE